MLLSSPIEFSGVLYRLGVPDSTADDIFHGALKLVMAQAIMLVGQGFQTVAEDTLQGPSPDTEGKLATLPSPNRTNLMAENLIDGDLLSRVWSV